MTNYDADEAPHFQTYTAAGVQRVDTNGRNRESYRYTDERDEAGRRAVIRENGGDKWAKDLLAAAFKKNDALTYWHPDLPEDDRRRKSNDADNRGLAETMRLQRQPVPGAEIRELLRLAKHPDAKPVFITGNTE
jgi:hypothetical protein